MAKVEDKVRTIIEQTVRERFAGHEIDRIVVTRDVDFDGDEVFTVRVVLADTKKVRPDLVSGLVRHIRGKLSSVDESRFPIVRMMSRRDSDDLVLNGS